MQELQEPVSVATPTRATGKRKSPGVPSDYCCPITLSPFIDPVTLLGDLEVYERRAIEQWLETSSKSPMHGTDLKSVSVVANSRMKGILEDAMNANRFGTDETKNWRVRVRANQEQKAVSEVEALKAQALDETTEKTARKEAARAAKARGHPRQCTRERNGVRTRGKVRTPPGRRDGGTRAPRARPASLAGGIAVMSAAKAMVRRHRRPAGRAGSACQS